MLATKNTLTEDQKAAIRGFEDFGDDTGGAA